MAVIDFLTRRPTIPQWLMIVVVAIYLTLMGSHHFFSLISEIYPPASGNILFLLSIGLLILSINCVVLSLLSIVLFPKIVASLLIMIASVVSYFQNEYGTIVDSLVIESTLQTDPAEVMDLLGAGFIRHIILTGIIPIGLLSRITIAQKSMWHSFGARLSILTVSIVLMLVNLFGFSAAYASFFREHKMVRMYVNPTMFVVSAIGLAEMKIAAMNRTPFLNIEARIPVVDAVPAVVLLVVGETARAESFALNGYERETTPRLARRKGLINFSDVSSCGTATAVSVPCMFSFLGREEFDFTRADSQSNLLDVLQTAGVGVLWRDNNSGSKGVALRVPLEDFRHRRLNPVCDEECRDIGMLSGLKRYIDGQGAIPTLIVIHQMGSHGPAYHKRYPPDFEVFKPTCQNEELSQCTPDAIKNAYDNSILYTDYFLDEAIGFLKENYSDRKAALVYVSDHGESLGEYDLFLHGLPYAIAPSQQTHVPMMIWLNEHFEKEASRLEKNRGNTFSHDNLPHTVIDLFDVETPVFNSELSILAVEE